MSHSAARLPQYKTTKLRCNADYAQPARVRRSPKSLNQSVIHKRYSSQLLWEYKRKRVRSYARNPDSEGTHILIWFLLSRLERR